MWQLFHKKCLRLCLPAFLGLLLASSPVYAVPRFVYTANYFDGSISTYRVDARTGMLYHLRQMPTLISPAALVLRPDGKFLYVISQTVDKIAIYHVDRKTGRLSEIKASPVDSHVRSCFRLAMSPDGKYLYVPGRFTSNLMVYRSDPESGELSPLKKNNFPTHGERSRFVTVSPDGRFVYVTNTHSNSLAAYKMDEQSETIQPVKGMPFPASAAPEATLIPPSGKYLYVANWQAARLTGYTINQKSGVLTPIPDFKAATGIYPLSGSVHPSGKYLYVVNYFSANVSGFHINGNNGQLTPIKGMQVATMDREPVNVRLDKAGRFAYVPSYADVSMTVFNVNEKNGSLVNPRRVMTRPGIRSMAILDADKQARVVTRGVVVASPAQSAISSYAFDPQTGELIPKHHVAIEGFSGQLAIDKEHHLVFAAEGQSVTVFRLGPDGQMQELVNQVVVDGGSIQALYADQRGSYLYVTTGNPARYMAYGINPQNGNLTLVKRFDMPQDALAKQIISTPEQRLNFVLDEAKNRIFMYRYQSGFGPNTYHLDQRGSPFTMGEGLSDMVVDATGRYGIVLQSQEHTVAVYRMPTIWNPIVAVQKKALSVGKKPVAIAMHPMGKYFYVLDGADNAIYQLRLDSETGKLVQVGQVTHLDGVPRSLSIDPSGRFAFLSYKSREGLTRFQIDDETGQLENAGNILAGVVPASMTFDVSIR